MKNALFIYVVLFLFAGKCYSQDKGFLSFSIGPAIPIGDFASDDTNNERAGLATLGTITDFTIGIKLSTKFGLTFLYRNRKNPLDNQAIIDFANELDPSIKWGVTSEDWKLNGFMFGLYSTNQVGASTTSFDLRLLFGILNATSTELTMTGTYGGVSAAAIMHSSKTSTFSYLVGVGFKFNPGKQICILLNLDFMGAEPEFEDVLFHSSNSAQRYMDFKQSFDSVNLGIGIGLRF